MSEACCCEPLACAASRTSRRVVLKIDVHVCVGVCVTFFVGFCCWFFPVSYVNKTEDEACAKLVSVLVHLVQEEPTVGAPLKCVTHVAGPSVNRLEAQHVVQCAKMRHQLSRFLTRTI